MTNGIGLLKRTKVKESAGDFRVSAGFYEALDDRVAELIDEAKSRAEKNDRATLMPHDL